MRFLGVGPALLREVAELAGEIVEGHVQGLVRQLAALGAPLAQRIQGRRHAALVVECHDLGAEQREVSRAPPCA
jgi:hypothetical protein